MPTYDPQRSRRRQRPADDAPAPVEALLEPHQVHLPDADVELSADGEEIIVHTDDADIEIRPDQHELVVSTAGQDLYVELADLDGTERVVGVGRLDARSARLVAIASVVALLVVVWAVLRRRRR